MVGRTEAGFRDDGMKVEERVYPSGDAAAGPTVTRWDETVDLAAGTRTRTETIGVDTDAAATTNEVSSLLHGGALWTIDPLGNRVTTDYDTLGRPVVSIDAKERVTTSSYETAQREGRNAVTLTTPDGVTRTEHRDELGRVTRLTDNILDGKTADGHERVIETRDYPEPGSVAVTDAWGATTTTRQDVFGRATETVGPNGLVQLTIHDDVARTTTSALTTTGQLADAELVAVQRHDVHGNPIDVSATRRDGVPAPETHAVYDGLGRPIGFDDGRIEARTTRDERGNPTTETFLPLQHGEDAAAVTATRRFDEAGRSLEKTLTTRDERRSGGARTVDKVGRTTTTTDPLGRTTSIKYTPDGLPERAVAASGQITEHRYDPLTRLATEISVTADGREPVRTAYAYDDLGRATGVYDPDDRDHTEITYEWNAFGELTDLGYPDGGRIVHEYDQHGRQIATTDVAGNRTEFAYDAAGLIARAVQHDEDGEELGRVDYRFDAFGRITELVRGDGVTTTYEHTSVDQISVERTANGTGPLAERRYEYDLAGNLSTRTDVVFEPDDDGPATTTTSYAYDEFGRLVRSVIHAGEHTDAPAITETRYELTVSGDIARETATTGNDTVVRAFDYGPSGELLAITTTDADGSRTTPQSYDSAGNLSVAADGGRTAYDAANRPITHLAADGTTASTTYWADGARRERAVTRPTGEAETTRFHWDDGALSTEQISTEQISTAGGDGSGDTVTVAYLRGLERHARTVIRHGDATTEYYGTDRHGNITELFDADGRAVTRYTYSDSGIRSRTHGPEASPANPFGYAGEYTHDDGTQHLSTRVYDPVTMRFTTQDTAELHNTYAYADLNPITKVDPSGLDAESDRRNMAFAVVGVLFAAVGLVTGGLFTAFGIVATGVALFDIAVALTETLNVVRAIELSEDTATGLAITGLVTGIVLGVAGIARGLMDTTASVGRRADAVISRSASDSSHSSGGSSTISSIDAASTSASSPGTSFRPRADSAPAALGRSAPQPASSVPFSPPAPPPLPPTLPSPAAMRHEMRMAKHTGPAQPPADPPFMQPAVREDSIRTSLSMRWTKVAARALDAYNVTTGGRLIHSTYLPAIARGADEQFRHAAKAIVNADRRTLMTMEKDFYSDLKELRYTVGDGSEYQDRLTRLSELSLFRYLWAEHQYAIDALKALY